MATQRVTVELSDPVFQQLVRIAEATSQPLEVLAAQSITSNLPPSPDNAPPEMQAELLRMQTLSIDELLEIAQSQIES
jgi:predicted transcriptional regulator